GGPNKPLRPNPPFRKTKETKVMQTEPLSSVASAKEDQSTLTAEPAAAPLEPNETRIPPETALLERSEAGSVASQCSQSPSAPGRRRPFYWEAKANRRGHRGGFWPGWSHGLDRGRGRSPQTQ